MLVELDRVGEVRKRAVRQAGFVVLKSPDIPSLLVETGVHLQSRRGEAAQGSAPAEMSSRLQFTPASAGYFYENPLAGTRVADLVGATQLPPDRKIPGPGRRHRSNRALIFPTPDLTAGAAVKPLPSRLARSLQRGLRSRA